MYLACSHCDKCRAMEQLLLLLILSVRFAMFSKSCRKYISAKLMSKTYWQEPTRNLKAPNIQKYT